MIIDDYINYTNKYKLKYGEKCIVLMQVGSFYEFYSIDDDTSNYIYNIADLCNIQISKKNKSISCVSISNPLMAGFPLYTLKKYTNILLNNNYTIVLIEQVTEPPNPERKLTEILSPGMNLNVENRKDNYMMVLYFEYIENMSIVGIAGIDLSTGKTFVYEAGSSKQDPEFSNDEVYRIISTYNPKEIIVLSDKNYKDTEKNYLMKNINRSNILIHYIWNNFEHMQSMHKISYQNVILEKAFFKKNMLSIIEMLNLEKYVLGRIALCCLLQFAYEHNVDIVHNLSKPDIINNTKYLTIEYNSALQLNILSCNNNEKPLIDILNRCSTSFGSRLFREKLLKPIVNISSLNESYDDIDYVLNNDKFLKIIKKLRNILDLERIKRKMIINKINPLDWINFKISIENAIDIMKNYYNYDTTVYEEMISNFTNIIDVEEASKYNLNDIKGNFFVKGVYQDIDNSVDEYDRIYKNITNIYNFINQIGEGDSTLCKIEFSDKDGYCICMTKKRYEFAKKQNNKYMNDFRVKTLAASNNVKLVNKEITNSSNKMDDILNNMIKTVIIYYKEFVDNFIYKYENDIDSIIKIISRIDIACCNAQNAKEFRYYRPIIEQNESSFVSAKYMRHPIIERIDERLEYIGNDIELKNNNNGMLLYGINAAGKSCLMKSIGLNIIMAQAGMFVASECMRYYPYNHIFTRISGMDNIYKGMSSFTVEMTELRNILQRCDNFSLVLGDEICSGTESISALAIVASGINVLVNKKTSFIFATHLHDLIDIGVVKQHIDKYILIKHIHITIDENNKIIYERKLKDGRGLTTYGIEVCKSLDMPDNFMKIAEIIRKEINGDSVSMIEPITSKYNNNIYMEKCKICGEKAQDTHHIKYQCMSDKDGNFTNFHQNKQHNLIPLCKQCHKDQHIGSIDIKGYIETSDGISVEYEKKGSEIQIDEESHQLNIDELESLKQFIKKGKTVWYMRKNKTNAFKECHDENQIIKKIQLYIKKNIILDDKIMMYFYDPKY